MAGPHVGRNLTPLVAEPPRRLPSRESDRSSGDEGHQQQQQQQQQHDHHHDHHHDHQDHHHAFQADGDPFFGRRLSVQKTPFSQASVETAGTSHAEVSEALAVNIYPHQNKSVLVVNHSNKPSESSSLEQQETKAAAAAVLSSSSAASSPHAEQQHQQPAEAGGAPADKPAPVTPPQPTFTMDDVDSPLRNPRAPPEPPAIQFIPATPSGLTPAQEKQKQLGNYFEEMTSDKPARPTSLLRRTLSLGRRAEYGPSASSSSRHPFSLTRTFSLSRNLKKRPPVARGGPAAERTTPAAYPTEESRPPNENMLHPFWRPAHWRGEDEGADGEDWIRRDLEDDEGYPYHYYYDDDDDYDGYDDGGGDAHYYPPSSNRRRLGGARPRRSLSARTPKT
ncbi:hypothetical protein VTK73DRAFT_4862 [Phialemonium thermophilum]|uniref:Uncharacterized protein n=1 Tax=Phialemonium thermophilum TaxID=223376 RepID=A0ABR3V6C7_9PEZI